MNIVAVVLAVVLGIYAFRKNARRNKSRVIELNFSERKNSEERHTENRGPHD